jgi:hypothetical protein
MGTPSVQVIVSFYPSPSSGNYFVLGDATQGVLGNATYLLAPSSIPVDVSQWLTGVATCNRGRSRETDQINAGTLTFSLRNENRYFDPTNTNSPYYPGVRIRSKVEMVVAGNTVFTGFVDDVNITYALAGPQTGSISTVDVSCVDALGLLACLTLSTWALDQEAVL